MGDANVFCDDLRYGASGATGVTKRYHGANEIIETKTSRLTLSGASATFSDAVEEGAILLGILAEVTGAITISGGSSWYVGDGTTVARWGASGVFTVGTKLFSQHWTTDNTVPIDYTGHTDIVITPDAGTFSAGEVEITVKYILYQG